VPAAMIGPVGVRLATTDSVAPGLPAAPVLPAAALDRLPAGPAGTDPVWRLVAAFLVGYPPATARAYLGDLRAWIGWCAAQGVHPFTARRHHVDHWARQLAAAPQPATGRPAAAATIARRLSCLSGFYDYGLREVELLEYSPVANVRRPRVSEDSPTVGLSPRDRLLTAAETHSPRSAALVSLLVCNGLRIDEALACDVTSLTYDRGHQALRITRKGGRASTEPSHPSCSAHCSTTSATAPTGRCSSTATTPPDWPTPPATPSSVASPAAPASRPPTGSAHAACGTASLSPLAFPYEGRAFGGRKGACLTGIRTSVGVASYVRCASESISVALGGDETRAT